MVIWLISTKKEKISVKLFHKPTKLAASFTTRSKTNSDPDHIVYQFKCKESDCTSTYIGYTTNKLSERAYQHRFKPSKISEHLKKEHSLAKINDIKDCFTALYTSNEVLNLKIAESYLIKTLKPDINIKHKEMFLRLNII